MELLILILILIIEPIPVAIALLPSDWRKLARFGPFWKKQMPVSGRRRISQTSRTNTGRQTTCYFAATFRFPFDLNILLALHGREPCTYTYTSFNNVYCVFLKKLKNPNFLWTRSLRGTEYTVVDNLRNKKKHNNTYAETQRFASCPGPANAKLVNVLFVSLCR